MAFNTVKPKPISHSSFTCFIDFTIQENDRQMPKSAHFSLESLIYIPFIGSWVHFGTCDSLLPCFNYFLLVHCDIMCFGLFMFLQDVHLQRN